MITPLKVFLAVILIAYPLIIFFGFKYTSPLTTNLFIIMILAARLVVTRKEKNPINTISFAVLILMVVICIIGIALKEFEFALLYPVVLNLSLFMMFAISLVGKRVPIIETLARIKEKHLPPKAIRYVRVVTIIWTLFFILNGLASLYTYLYCSFDIWTLYNGFLSYLIIGIIGAVEFTFRMILKKRWDNTRSLEVKSNFCDFNKVTFTQAEFLKEQNKIKNYFLRNTNIQKVGISCLDSYRFACVYLALAELELELVMLPNYQVKTLENYNEHYDLVVDDDVFDSFEDISHFEPSELNLKLESSITMFTSGSQGEPQVVRKKLRHLISECDALEETFGDFSKRAIFFSSVSHHHIYGLLFRVLWPLVRGSEITMTKIEYPEQLDTITNLAEKDCIFISSPAFLKRLDSELKPLKYSGNIKVFSSGGPLSLEGATSSKSFFGSLPFEIYGSTETGGIAWRKQTSIKAYWELLPGVSAKLDARNCLKVSSPYVSGDEFQTNDNVKIFENKRLELVGRVDRTVKIEEKRLSLDELEKVLKKNPNIADAHCVVINQGERVIIGCLIVLNAENEWKNCTKIAMVKKLKTYLLQYFEAVLLPRKYRFLDELPYNAQSKLVKSTVLGYFDDTSRNSI